jgi:hypothetical protein
MQLKKLILLFLLFSAVISNAQRTMFVGQNNYVAPTIFSPPTLSGTSAISTISRYGASSGGTITSNGGATITASGVCWSSLLIHQPYRTLKQQMVKLLGLSQLQLLG